MNLFGKRHRGIKRLDLKLQLQVPLAVEAGSVQSYFLLSTSAKNIRLGSVWLFPKATLHE